MAYRTGIDTTGSMKCPNCGDVNVVEIRGRSGFTRCQTCDMYLSWSTPIWSGFDVLALFGYALALDYDGQLIVESEEPLPAHVRDWLFRHQGSLRETLEFKGRRARAVFVGGSLNGQLHDRGGCEPKGSRIVRRIGPRHWEVYVCRESQDPRRYYVGRTTSEAKAKRGEFSEAENTNR